MTGALHPLCAPVDRGGYRPALRRFCPGPHLIPAGRAGGCGTNRKALTGLWWGLPFDSAPRRYWDASGPLSHPHTGPSEFYRKEDAADHPLVPRTPALMGNLPARLAGGWLKQSWSPATFFGEAA